jgi:hypothetical protein
VRSQSFLRDTALFVLLAVCGMAGTGFLVAVVQGEPPSVFLGALFTDGSFLFACLVLFVVWWRLYPRLSSGPER